MANEIQVRANPGIAVYFLIRNTSGQIWNNNTSAFVAYATISYANYVSAMTQQGTASGYYLGNFPNTIIPGIYSIVAKQQVGGSPVETDPDVGYGNFDWSGAVPNSLSMLPVSGQLTTTQLSRGVQILNFPFYLISAADSQTPFTSGICSGSISKDGAAFGPLQSGAFTELGFGAYSLQALTSGDLLCNTAALYFSANGVSGGNALPRTFTLLTQRTSGN